MVKKVSTQLVAEGIKYVRWAFAGSYDNGGIVEVKLFDFKEQPVREICIYDPTPDADSLDGKLLEIGEKFLDKIRGFEINDGGYGWFLLDTESQKITSLLDYNDRGMHSEYFDCTELDRIEISLYEKWNTENSDADCLDVKITYTNDENEVILNNEQKNKFLSFTRHVGNRKRKNFFDAGGKIFCNINGKRLHMLLVDLGLSVNEKLYYRADNVQGGHPASRTQDEILDEIILKIDSRYQYELCTIFISGWSNMFNYNVKDEQDVIDVDPFPIEIMKLKSKET